MKALARVSLILGVITTLAGYAMIAVNVISLRKSDKVRKIVE